MYLEEKIPDVSWPAFTVALVAMPLNVNGKVDSAALPVQMAAGPICSAVTSRRATTSSSG